MYFDSVFTQKKNVKKKREKARNFEKYSKPIKFSQLITYFIFKLNRKKDISYHNNTLTGSYLYNKLRLCTRDHVQKEIILNMYMFI